MEIHKETILISEIHAKEMENKVILIIVLSNGKVLAYENLNSFPDCKKQRFRFKIIQNYVLRKHMTVVEQGHTQSIIHSTEEN